MDKIKIATYNVHKCRGLDNRVRPARIADILREMDADIVALQEVLSIEGKSPEENQARYFSEQLEMHYCLGETRRLRGGAYGNVLLSRFPLRQARNYDLSVRGREQRGCLRADVHLSDEQLLHIFNVHLGTAFIERRHQARKLINSNILTNEELKGARIMLGDFNEWTRGLTTRLLASHLKSADLRNHLRRSRTYPGVLPLLHLDHIYFDEAIELKGMTLHRSRAALIASDHLPLLAEFRLQPNGHKRDAKSERVTG